MTEWKLFTPEAITAVPYGTLIVIRRPDGKCWVGALLKNLEWGVQLASGVWVHDVEQRPNIPMVFTTLSTPEPEFLIKDRQLPLTG